VVTFPLCGYLISEYGWESGFYVIGSITMIWFVFWCFLVFDTPDKHPRISHEEKLRIKES
jgi:ACS family sodium-dependent inorganic phosphate cotransporter